MSGNVQASGWRSLVWWLCCQVQDKCFSPSVTIRTFIPAFRTWHVPNCPISPCPSLKCAAKHWVWNTSLQLSKHKPKCIQESRGGSGWGARMIRIGQDSKCHLNLSIKKVVLMKRTGLTCIEHKSSVPCFLSFWEGLPLFHLPVWLIVGTEKRCCFGRGPARGVPADRYPGNVVFFQLPTPENQLDSSQIRGRLEVIGFYFHNK